MLILSSPSLQSPGACSQECADFLTTLKTRLGCCARTPIDFYLADDYLTNALTQGAKRYIMCAVTVAVWASVAHLVIDLHVHSEGLEAQLNTFYKNAMEQCNVGLPTACQSGIFLCEVVDVRAKHAVTYNT